MSEISIDSKRRRFSTGLLACAVASLGARAHASTSPFPSRPVRLVVPFAAGGGTDIMARLLAKAMAQELGQPVVVENRAGAGGGLGSAQVARAAPDGYTVLMGTASTHAINPAVYRNLPYQPQTDFTPISLAATIPGVVLVNAKSNVASLADLAASMRERPNALTYGTQGQGGLGHLMGEMFNAQAGVKSVHVPYRGAAPALQDLLAGNIDIVYDTLPAVIPHLQGGKLRALAITASQRSDIAPDVPTAAQAGYPAFLAQTWNALFGPAGLPADVAARLTAAAVSAVNDPETNGRIREMSAAPVASDSAGLAELVRADMKHWENVAKQAGIKLD